MSKDEIIWQNEILEMARQAQVHEELCGEHFIYEFAKLVGAKARAKEREACAKICEYERNDPDDQFKNYEDTHDDGWIDGCNSCIAAIRARGTEA